jgi:hypothetical protein
MAEPDPFATFVLPSSPVTLARCLEEPMGKRSSGPLPGEADRLKAEILT